MQRGQTDSEEQTARKRAKMVRQQLTRRGVSDPRVLAAMESVPRHRFVPETLQHLAYDDAPLPIGGGQTISQPYIVALMTQLVSPRPEDHVLEIGVGSGYQTAVLAELARDVVGLERLPELAEKARETLAALGYQNVTIHVADGTLGYAPAAPYDIILAAAAAPEIPSPLLHQLAVGGRLVMPIGHRHEQIVRYVQRSEEGFTTTDLTPVRFVPMIGQHGFENDEDTGATR